MTVNCLACGDPIDIGEAGGDDGEVHITMSARRGFRESWKSFGRVHVECFHERVGEGEFDPEDWVEEIA